MINEIYTRFENKLIAKNKLYFKSDKKNRILQALNDAIREEYLATARKQKREAMKNV